MLSEVVILNPSASDCNVPRIDGDKGYSIGAYTVGTFFFSILAKIILKILIKYWKFIS